MNDVQFRAYLNSMRKGRNQIRREARIIEVSSIPTCPQCGTFCHCDMIQSKKAKIAFVQTGICPNCQDENFWGNDSK